jgi:hypothetical protein
VSTNGNTGEPEWEIDFRDHFFYFPDRTNADAAAKRLLAKGWTAQVAPSPDGQEWSVFATELAPREEDFEATRLEMENMAEESGGRYDGWGGPG